MFTGIIQAVGKAAVIQSLSDAVRMTVHCPGFFVACRAGDSVANNGVCLTVEQCDADTARFTLIRQTMENSSFGKMEEGGVINLELPCRGDSLLGGHYVMGHVDGMAVVEEVISRETGCEVLLQLPESSHRYVIERGSITLDGISLTVASKTKTGIRVALIPETIAKTNAVNWAPGFLVNYEVDMMAKYVENFLRQAGLLKDSGSC